MRLLPEVLWANGTLKWSLIGVSSRVVGQMSFSPECFCAEGTMILFLLISMNIHVHFQSTVLPEGLATNWALERPLITVNKHVPSQLIQTAEVLATCVSVLWYPFAWRILLFSAESASIYTFIVIRRNVCWILRWFHNFLFVHIVCGLNKSF